MSYLLTKLLPLFVYPLGITLLLCFAALLFMAANRKKIALFSIFLAIAVLWSSSTPIVADAVIGSLEHRYPPLTVETTPSADAIVILGGVTRGIVPGTGLTDLDAGVDRLIHGARLFLDKKAPLVVLSGGNAEGFQPESEAMADILKIMGIPEKAMLLESKSRNTYQNGLNTAPILRKQAVKHILLVTSAYHMRRAVAIFEGMGISVISAATDYQLVERAPSILDWLPQAEALNTTTRGIKEYIGWWVYSLRTLLH
jgi:uncharacterized SAM-binding protein YcdF (DUF218 family)